jgi:two-component system, LytTR family, response regulator
MYTYYVVDDEKGPIKILTQMISEISALQLVGVSTKPIHALAEIKELLPDIVFLDINMPGISGLELVDLIKPLPKKIIIIFITGLLEHALESYDLGVVDYLVKPLKQKRLVEAISKAKEVLGKNVNELSEREKILQKRILLFSRDNREQISFLLADIDYIKAMGNYVAIYRQGKGVLVRKKLKEVLEKLHNSYFIQIHKSYIIKIDENTAIQGDKVILKSGAILSIGPNYKKALLEAMQIFTTNTGRRKVVL